MGKAGLAMLAGWSMAIAGTASAQIPTAQVTGGTIAGVVGDGLSTFKGISFAAPPVGALRWKAPQPVAAWKGAKQTNAFGPPCMQEPKLAAQMGDPTPASEDCLYLNVWSPAKAAGERLPVIVWIYGGGYNSGMTSVPLYDGANFARKGVVFVSVNYRVGPFGFLADPALSEESGHGSGAWGMMDQIAGLKWVKANIAKFGGDPGKVTIMGHSAGASAVSILAGSPLTKGLFRGVIAESGSNFAPPSTNAAGMNMSTLAAAEAKGANFLAGLGATTLAAARALPAETIEKGADTPGAPRFSPPLDGYVVAGDQSALWKSGRFNDTPILIGSNSDEAAAFGSRPTTPAAFEADVRKTYGAQADAVLAAYPHGTDADAMRATKQLRRDSTFGWGMWAWAKLQAANGKGKPYLYYFDKPTAQNPDGSSHGAEVALVFANPDLRGGRAGWTDEDRAISNMMQSYWVNFAMKGDPNGPGLPSWPAFSAASPQVMRLGTTAGAGPVPNAEKYQAVDAYNDGVRLGK